MKSHHWNSIQSLFESALAMSPEERNSFLNAQCEDDEIKEEVSNMLFAHEGSSLRLEQRHNIFSHYSQPPNMLGNYRVVKEIGQGGMGKVYLGSRHDGTFERQVAIKTLTRVTNTRLIRERFDKERRLHAKLEHPNIVQILDAGTSEQGLPFLVMHYVDGVPITEYVEKNHCGISHRVELVIQLCEAVAVAHAQLILHRDIKPSNILVTAEGRAMLLDFGIAKLLNVQDNKDIHTQASERLLTLAYASPEQIEEDDLTTASDVYSLGNILYETLTGARPFTQTKTHDLANNILKASVLPPTVTDTGLKIPADLQAICLKALEKPINKRYASASELAADLKRFQNNEVVTVRKPSYLYRVQKFWQRHPISSSFGVIASVTIIGTLTLALLQTERAKQQRDIANKALIRSEQITELLTGLFTLNPYGISKKQRAEITLQDILTSKAETMERQLSNQPDLQADMFETLAKLYEGLSQYQTAESYAKRALSLRRELHGDLHQDVAHSLDVLGGLFVRQHKNLEAKQVFEQALNIKQAMIPLNIEEVTKSMAGVVAVMLEIDNPEDEPETIHLLNSSLNLAIENFGSESIPVAQMYILIAGFHVRQKVITELKIAEGLGREALSIYRKSLGNTHPAVSYALMNFANTLYALDQLEEAETLLLEAINIVEGWAGENHHHTARPVHNLGQVYKKQNQLNKALELFQRSLAINSSRLPADHPDVIEDLLALTDIYILSMDKRKANEYSKRLLALEFDQKERWGLDELQKRIDSM